MPEIYFNPYPGPADDARKGKQYLISLAESVLAIKKHLDQAYNPQGDIPIGKFVLYKDIKSGAHQTIPGMLQLLEGREREIVRRFLMFFDRGRALNADDLEICRDWIIKCLGTSAPVLEYAARQKGIAATLPTEIEWECDFLEFEHRLDILPNLFGQTCLIPLYTWIEKWYKNYSDFSIRLEKVCGLAICQGAMEQHAPSPSEYDVTLNMIQRSALRNFEHDGYLIKDVLALEKGTLKQIKQKGSGIRVYIGYDPSSKPCLSGFYKKGKGDARAQNKAISKAGKRADFCLSNDIPPHLSDDFYDA